MTILNVQTETIGQTGLIPRFVYIETNNNVLEVVDPGFLNSVVSQGTAFNETEMALVSTKINPGDAASQTSLYSISHNAGNWSLVPIFSVTPVTDSWLLSGNLALGPATFGTLNNISISFKANNQTYMTFDTTALRLDVSAANFRVISSSSASIFANNTSVDATTSLTLGSISPLINIGVNASTANINSATIKLNNLPLATKSDAVFFDSSTKQLSYGPAGSGGSNDWLLDGNVLTAGKVLGSTNNQSFNVIVNSIPQLQLAPTSMIYGVAATTAHSFLGATAGITANLTVTGSYFLTSPSGLASTLLVSNATLTLQGLGSGQVRLTSLNSTFTVLNNTINASATTLISLQTTAGPMFLQGQTVHLRAVTNMLVEAVGAGSQFAMLSDGDATFESTSGDFRFNAPDTGKSVIINGNFVLNTIPAATKPDILFYDSTTKMVSYGPNTSGGADWLVAGNSGTGGTGKLGTTDAQPFSLIANNTAFMTIGSNHDVAITPNEFSVDAFESLSLACRISLILDTQQSIFIGNTNTLHMFVGKAANDLQIACSQIAFQNIPNTLKPDLLYYDSSSGLVSFGAAGTSAPAWILAGNNGAGNKLGTIDANGFTVVANNSTVIDFLSDKTTTFTSGPLFSADATRIVVAPTLATTVEIGHAAMTTMTATADNVTVTGTTTATFTAPLAVLSGAAAKVNGNHIYIGDVTPAINIGGVSTTTSTFTADVNSITGTSQLSLASNAQVDVGNFTTPAVNIRSTNAGSVLIDGDQIKLGSLHATNINIGTNATTQTNINSVIVNLVGTSTSIIDALATQVGPTIANNVTIGRNPSTTIIASNSLRAPNITAASTSNVLYWDSSSGSITRAPLPTASSSWLLSGNGGAGYVLGTTTNDPFSIIVNNANVIQLSSSTIVYGIGSTTTHSFLGNNFTVNTSLSAVLTSPLIQLKNSGNTLVECSTTQLNLGNTGFEINLFNNGNVYLRNIPAAVKPNVVYIDQTNNGKLSYGTIAAAGAVTKVVTQSVATVGAGIYHPTAGMLYVTVEAVGGGASGQGTTGNTGGAGGGAGGYVKKTYAATELGTANPFTIGAGGPPTSASTPGGNTTFGTGITLITASGAPAISTSGGYNAGGQGGTGSGGDLNLRGSAGGNTFKIQSFNMHGRGGASFFGGQTPGGLDQAVNQNGAAGVGYGSGGEGGISFDSSGSLGGAGVGGVIVFTEYIAI